MTRLTEPIRSAVLDWRDNGYPGVSDTTKRLLEYWFKQDHLREAGNNFQFWDCQRESIETIIYLYEVCEYHSLREISDGFDQYIGFDPSEDKWPKYCLKMATGSGKTFVMVLSLVWQYFNDLYEDDGSTRFLLISPNLIVHDRLIDGFEEQAVFDEFPFFVPDEWENDFDVQVVNQSDDFTEHSEGVIHITNVQQLYEYGGDGSVDQPVQKMLESEGGKKPVSGEELKSETDLRSVISEYDDVVVLNDEAHHAHTETQWNEAIHEINGEEDRVSLQLDFTATAWDVTRDQQVALPHIIYDYRLKRAIEDGIVKRPSIISTVNAPKPVGDEFIEQYQSEIHTAHEYLQHEKKELDDVGKKPVLLALCDSTEHADEVADYFRDDLGYGDKVLLIHTYVRGSKYGGKGDVKRDQLEKVREAAKNIDENEYEVVVSVLMLKEGWDVRNVSVILPMRAFGSDILTEQTLGRGLRPMFPQDRDLTEELYVIEHPSFEQLWREKIEEEELPIDIREPNEGHKESKLIQVDNNKLGHNLTLPIVEGGISRSAPNLSELTLDSLPSKVFSIEEIEVREPKAIETDLLTGEKLGVRSLQFEYAYSKQEYFSHLTKSILKDSASSSQFANLVPFVKKYVLEHLFKENISEFSDEILNKLNSAEVRREIYNNFVEQIRLLTKTENEYRISSNFELTEVSPFHTTKNTHTPAKSIFNKLPCDSSLEKDFMTYLDRCPDVISYTKIFWRIPIRITYFDDDEKRRYYIPDFVVKHQNGNRYVIETKGEMFDNTPTVNRKANAAEAWCKNLSEISDFNWKYVKISGDVFEENKNIRLDQLLSIAST